MKYPFFSKHGKMFMFVIREHWKLIRALRFLYTRKNEFFWGDLLNPCPAKYLNVYVIPSAEYSHKKSQ